MVLGLKRPVFGARFEVFSFGHIRVCGFSGSGEIVGGLEFRASSGSFDHVVEWFFG